MTGDIVVSDDNRAIARHVMAAFGGRQPRMTRMTSDDGTFHVDVATTADCPTAEVASSSTIGLSDVQLFQPDGTPFDATRIELVSAYHLHFDVMRNMLFRTAFHIKTRKWLCRPDVVLEGILSRLGLVGDLRHFYFEEPFLWDGFDNLELPSKTVAWLYAIPISDRERLFIKDQSLTALDQRWQDQGTDLFDLERRSAV